MSPLSKDFVKLQDLVRSFVVKFFPKRAKTGVVVVEPNEYDTSFNGEYRPVLQSLPKVPIYSSLFQRSRLWKADEANGIIFQHKYPLGPVEKLVNVSAGSLVSLNPDSPGAFTVRLAKSESGDGSLRFLCTVAPEGTPITLRKEEYSLAEFSGYLLLATVILLRRVFFTPRNGKLEYTCAALHLALIILPAAGMTGLSPQNYIFLMQPIVSVLAICALMLLALFAVKWWISRSWKGTVVLMACTLVSLMVIYY